MKHSSHICILCLCAVLVLLLHGACSRTSDSSGADARQDIGSEHLQQTQPLRLGLIPEQNIFTQKERYSALLELVGERINRPVEIKILTGYDKVLDAFKQREVDGAFLGSFTAATIISVFDATPLAVQVRPDGATSYRGVMITRRDSGISSDIASWRDRSLALVHPHTSAGYLFPKKLLREAGHNDLGAYFQKVTLLGSHDAVALEVLEKRAEIGALKDSVLRRFFEDRPDAQDAIHILQTSESYPATSLVLTNNVHPEIAQRLQEELFKLHQTTEGREALSRTGVLRFDPTSIERYRPLQKTIRRQLTAVPLLEGARR